jgi:hypothetical protein
MLQSTPVVAFDQHAASLVAAVLLPGQGTPAVQTLTPDLPTVRRFLQRLRHKGPVQCCYEAGPCGFDLQRALVAEGIAWDVIAPALIPRRPGVRIKTDRRDAAQLAILYRAGALTRILAEQLFTVMGWRDERFRVQPEGRCSDLLSKRAGFHLFSTSTEALGGAALPFLALPCTGSGPAASPVVLPEWQGLGLSQPATWARYLGSSVDSRG